MRSSGRAARMARHHQRHKGGSALNLVSLMDIFTILVFFLLVNSTEVEVLPNAKEIKLPESIAEQKPEENVVVMVTANDILVQGRAVATLDEAMAIEGNIIPGLRDALLAQNERTLSQELREDVAGREVTIMGDREIPYRLLKKVMATCTDADYGRLSLAVVQKSGEAQIAQLGGA